MSHFLAESVAALLTWSLLLIVAALSHGLALLAGVRWERRRRWRSRARMLASYTEAMQETVPLRHPAGGDR